MASNPMLVPRTAYAGRYISKRKLSISQPEHSKGIMPIAAPMA
jgi:hypothetical protein